MEASKFETLIYHLVNELAIKLKQVYLCFGSPGIAKEANSDDVRPNGRKPVMENLRWRPLSLNYLHFGLHTRWKRNSNG